MGKMRPPRLAKTVDVTNKTEIALGRQVSNVIAGYAILAQVRIVGSNQPTYALLMRRR